MRQNIAHRNILIGQRIVQMEKWNISIHFSVPLHSSFIHQNGNRGRCECFRAGPNVKERVGRDRLIGANIPNAETLHINDGAIAHDCNRCARHFPIFHRGIYVLIERRPVGSFLSETHSRRSGQEDEQHSHTDNRFPVHLIFSTSDSILSQPQALSRVLET